MLQKASLAFGIILTAVGVFGFIPVLTPDGMLLGIFHVDTVHNIIHLASGLAALFAASNPAYSKLYFQIFGVVYALVAVAGFIPGLVTEDDRLLGLFHINMADNWLHVAIAGSALYLGFIKTDKTVRARES